LAPVLDVINGKTLLYNINAQYGFGVIYALSLVFLNNPAFVNFENFSILLNLVDILQYLLFAFFIKHLTNHKISIILLVIFIIICRANPYGGMIPQMFPSTGSFRFFWGYAPLFILLSTLNKKHKLVVSFIMTICAFIWSVESYIYNIASTIIVINGAGFLRRSKIISNILFVSGSLLIGILAQYIITFLRVGVEPDYRHYLQFFQLYGGGFGFMTPDPQGAWSFFALLYGAIIFIFVKDYMFGEEILTRPDDHAELSVVCGMLAVLGYAEMSYYVFRPSNSNLYHIMWPAIILSIIGIDWCLTNISIVKINKHLLITIIFIIVIQLINSISRLKEQMPFTVVGKILRESMYVFDNSKWNEYEKTIAEIYILNERERSLRNLLMSRLIDGTSASIPIIVEENTLINARMGLALVNFFGITYEHQDEVIPISIIMIAERVNNIKIGTNIIVDSNSVEKKGLRKITWDLINQKFVLGVVSRDKFFDILVVQELRSDSVVY